MKRRLLFLGALAPLLAACVGVGVISSHTGTPQNVTLAKSRGNIVIVPPKTSIPLMTKEAVRKGWGEPDKIEHHGELERWIYNKDLTWSGVLVFAVFIPIPLLVPVGHDHLAIDFRNEFLANIETTGQGHMGFICAVPMLVPHGNGCESESPPKEGEIDRLFIDKSGMSLVGFNFNN